MREIWIVLLFGFSEDDKLATTVVKLPSGYSQLDCLEEVFGGWDKLMRIIQYHLSLDRVIVNRGD